MKAKKVTKSSKSTSSFLLPPDAKHFIQEDLQVAPAGFFDNMTSDQVDRPALQVIQPMSRIPNAIKNIGTIYNTVTREFSESIEIAVIVAPGENDVPRTMRSKKFDRNGAEVYDYDAPVICGSANGVYPFRNFVNTKIKNELGEEFEGEIIPDQCAGCVFADSGVCKQYFRYFVMQIQPDNKVVPAVMRLKGMALASAKNLNTQLQRLSEKGEYWSFTMGVRRVSRRKQVFVPTFESCNRITDNEFLHYVAGLRKDYYTKQARILEDNTMRVQQLKEDDRSE